VTGLTTDLANRVLTSDSRLTNARTPTAHATSHQYGGTDALSLDWTQVSDLHGTGDTLPVYLATLAPLSTVTTQANQISTLQSQVTFLLGGGTPTSSPIKAVWFDGTSTFTGVTNPAAFQTTYSVLQKSPFGQSASDGTYYYNPAGANANEWVYPYITPNGHLQLRKWNESNPPDTVYATQTAFNALQTQVNGCATQAALTTVQTQVNAAATQASVNALSATVSTLATQASVNSLASQVGNCASQSALNSTNATVATLATQASVNSLSSAISSLATQASVTSLTTTVSGLSTGMATKADLVSGTVPLNEMPQNIPISYVSGLATTLAGLCPLSSGTVPLTNLPSIPQSQVTGLTSALSNLCPLVGGQIPSQYLPSLSINDVFVVNSTAAMLAESTAHVGDICVITGTSAQGTYILTATPPSTLTNWTLLPSSQSVVSVNGQTGAVNLTAASLGALTSSSPIPQTQVTGLTTALATFATTSALTTAVTGLQSLSQVQNTLTTSTMVKQAANYVANAPISLSGQTTIDGVYVPLNSIVLATAQPSSVNNGLWVVQSGPWQRTNDFATGNYFVRGTVVFVQSGATLANTIWQLTSTSGTVDSSANNWTNIMTAGGPITYTGTNGITVTTSGSTGTVTTNLVPNSGLIAGSSGLAVNFDGTASSTAQVVRKYVGIVPAGYLVAPIYHNLGTTHIGAVYVRQAGSSNCDQVLVCPTIQGPNSLTLEFGQVTTTNQWEVVVMG
jgi:hypothetical protein